MSKDALIASRNLQFKAVKLYVSRFPNKAEQTNLLFFISDGDCANWYYFSEINESILKAMNDSIADKEVTAVTNQAAHVSGKSVAQNFHPSKALRVNEFTLDPYMPSPAVLTTEVKGTNMQITVTFLLKPPEVAKYTMTVDKGTMMPARSEKGNVWPLEIESASKAEERRTFRGLREWAKFIYK